MCDDRSIQGARADRDGGETGLSSEVTSLEDAIRRMDAYRERLRRLEAGCEGLMQMLVHDMRSPLAAIMGNAELLEQLLDETAPGTESLDLACAIVAASFRMRDMIANLSDIGRIEAGTRTFEPETGDLREVLRDVLGEPEFRRDVRRLGYAEPAEPRMAFFDRKVTRRMITSLLLNACKYGGADMPVDVELLETEDAAGVAVHDHGEAIPEACRDMVFQKTEQARARLEYNVHTAGIALTFCRLAAEAQGGRIGVESEPGRGRRFWFLLPSRAPDPESREPVSVPGIPERTCH